MTLISDHREARRLAEALSKPSLPFLGFSITELFAGIRAEWFPEISLPVHVFFVHRGPLACIVAEDARATIYIHQILNHSETPVEVMRHILKHELLHLRIRHREIDGKQTYHPPEFWEAERAISQERSAAWCWIWINLNDCIRLRRKEERIGVRSNWKSVWSNPMTSLEDCLKLSPRLPKQSEQVGL